MLLKFKNEIIQMIEKFSQQEEKLNEITKIIAQKIIDGGTFYAIGTGHSHMVGEEFYARAGGLACIQLIAPMELTLGEHPLKSTQIERISEYAHVILSQYKLKSGDVILISSNSGRNSMPIELAIECKKRGITTIAFTSMSHSSEVKSRHQSGQRLFEVCDYVIDNCGVIGDALIEVDNVKGKMGASSSIIGMYMVQSLSILLAEKLTEKGKEAPVFISANIDEGDDWNKSLMEEYYNL